MDERKVTLVDNGFGKQVFLIDDKYIYVPMPNDTACIAEFETANKVEKEVAIGPHNYSFCGDLGKDTYKAWNEQDPSECFKRKYFKALYALVILLLPSQVKKELLLAKETGHFSDSFIHNYGEFSEGTTMDLVGGFKISFRKSFGLWAEYNIDPEDENFVKDLIEYRTKLNKLSKQTGMDIKYLIREDSTTYEY